MQLNITTGYAVRVVIFLAQTPGLASGAEICAKTAVPPSVLPSVVKPLKEAGIIETRRGNQGGLTLTRAPRNISMADIIRAMEGTTRINHCLEPDCRCTLGKADTCKVREFYLEVQRWLDKTFEEKTIASLLDEPYGR